MQVIYQDLSLFPNLTVAENIAFDANLGAYARPVRWARMREVARAALQRLHFDLPLEAKVDSLPVAERQVVAICRGLVAKARLLFMDEPTSSLTRAEVNNLLAIVGRLKAERITVVFVSHRLDEVVEVAERITVLRDGRKVGTYLASEVDQKRIGVLMTGLEIDSAVHARDVGGAPVVLQVDGLTRRGEYRDVSFQLRRGEVLGLIGLLGSGRTELALSLSGMTRPDAGTIRLNGATLATGSRTATRSAPGIAYLSEDRLNLGVNIRQSVADNLILGGDAPACRQERADFVDRAPRFRRALDRPARRSRRRLPSCRCNSSRAATSSASCWRSGWRRSRRC